MSKFYKTSVPPEVTVMIQKLFYEVELKKGIIKDMIRDEGESIRNNENFKYYQEDLSNTNFQYQEANAELERTLFPPEFVGNYNYEWKITFATNVVMTEVKDEAGIKLLEEAGYVLE